MMPSLAWQTQVSDLPCAGGHFVPVGSAEVSGTVSSSSSRRESRSRATIIQYPDCADFDNVAFCGAFCSQQTVEGPGYEAINRAAG